MSTAVDNAKFIRTLKFFDVLRKGGLRAIDADLAFAQAKSRGRCSLNFRGFCEAVQILSLRKYGKVMAPEHALSSLLQNDTKFGVSTVKGHDFDQDDYDVGIGPEAMGDQYDKADLVGEEY